MQEEAGAPADEPLLSADHAAEHTGEVVGGPHVAGDTDTFWPCVANLSKVIIGAGMMAIPQAYSRIGSLAGTSMLVLVGLMTYTTLVFLLQGSAATGAATYSQLTRVMCGPVVMKVLQVAVLSFCFGFGVVYLVIIRDILLGTPPACNGLLCELLGLSTSSSLYDGRVVIVAVALLVCAPLLLFRTMDRLAVLNVVGVGAIAMLATVAVGLGVQGLATGTVFPIPLLPQWQQLGHTTAEQLQALTAVMPVMIACYVAHQSLHPLMPLLQPYSDARMRGVIAAALLIAFGVFGSLAVGSCLAFGPNLEVNVLNNYSVSGLQPLTGGVLARLLSWSIRGGYLLSLLASLLLYMHPLRACLAEMAWPDNSQPGTASQPGSPSQGQAESTGLLLPVAAAPDQGRSDAGGGGGGGSSSGVAVQHGKPNGAASAAAGQAGSSQSSRSTASLLPASGESGGAGNRSVFAVPAAQAAAAAAGAAPPLPPLSPVPPPPATAAAVGLSSVESGAGNQRSSGGGTAAAGTAARLTTFDSMDNPRGGSWSQVQYVAGAPPDSAQRDGQQQQRQQQQRQGQGQRHQQRVQYQDLSGNSHSGGAANGPEMLHPLRQVVAYGAGRGGSSGSISSSGVGQQHQRQQRWQQAEQQYYYPLTYGLLTVMVLVAIVVPNIWTALSAIGDLASTLQAFVVPGLVGLLLAVHGSKGGSEGEFTSGNIPQCSRRTRLASGAVGGVVVALGLLLFANGIYQRV